MLSLDDYLEPAFVEKFHSRTRRGRWGCIEWNGARNRGYGTLMLAGHSVVAHRVAWIISHGELIPHDLVIDHLCCNKGCVSPAHLEAVTGAENLYRMLKAPKGWQLVGPTYPRRRRFVPSRAK